MSLENLGAGLEIIWPHRGMLAKFADPAVTSKIALPNQGRHRQCLRMSQISQHGAPRRINITNTYRRFYCSTAAALRLAPHPAAASRLWSYLYARSAKGTADTWASDDPNSRSRKQRNLRPGAHSDPCRRRHSPTVLENAARSLRLRSSPARTT